MLQLSKGGDRMVHFIEGILELIFGLAKDTPESMPEIEYKNSFIVKNTNKKMIMRIIASLIVAIVFCIGCIFVDFDTRILFFAFIVLLAFIALFSIDALSFRCFVNEQNLTASSFFMLKKSISWGDVICVRKCETTNEKSVWIVLYGKDKKSLLDISTEMENAWYIVKMAEYKNIEIREEKDLTIKQMHHL
jgi:hypothetical protein